MEQYLVSARFDAEDLSRATPDPDECIRRFDVRKKHAQDYGLLEECTNLIHTPDVIQVRQEIPNHKRAYEMGGWWCAIGSHKHTAGIFVRVLVHFAWAQRIKGHHELSLFSSTPLTLELYQRYFSSSLQSAYRIY